MDKYRIHPLYIARLYADVGTFCYLNFTGEKRWFPIYSWLIEGAGRFVLVDTGCDAAEVMRSSVLKAPYENETTIEEALKRFGLSPELIDTLVLTHLHADHALNVKKFTRAKIYVQEREVAFAYHPHPLFLGTFPKGRFDGINFFTINGDFRLAEGIDLLFTPGHTAGTQSVAVQTGQGRVIICGACSLPENFLSSGTTEVVPPGIHLDPLQSYDSLLRIKREADLVLPLHDETFKDGMVIG